MKIVARTPTELIIRDSATTLRVLGFFFAALGAFAVFAAPYLLGGLLPALAALWPTAIGASAIAVATGSELDIAAIAGWATSLVIAGAVGVLVLDREDM